MLSTNCLKDSAGDEEEEEDDAVLLDVEEEEATESSFVALRDIFYKEWLLQRLMCFNSAPRYQL